MQSSAHLEWNVLQWMLIFLKCCISTWKCFLTSSKGLAGMLLDWHLSRMWMWSLWRCYRAWSCSWSSYAARYTYTCIFDCLHGLSVRDALIGLASQRKFFKGSFLYGTLLSCSAWRQWLWAMQPSKILII